MLYAPCAVRASNLFEGVTALMEPDKLILNKEDAVLLIVDIQERLAVVMKDKDKWSGTAST
jgi:hypothetical protein